MEQTKKILGFLGLCMRARQLVLGQEKCVDAIRKETVSVVLMDETASANTKKRIEDACASHSVPVQIMGEDEMGLAIGKDGCMVVAITKGNMADKVKSLMESETICKE